MLLAAVLFLHLIKILFVLDDTRLKKNLFSPIIMNNFRVF